jgi:RNA polymerase sigma-70 factor (ECF subfamily)
MSMPSAEKQRSFEELLAQARSGSRKAFQELVEPFARALRLRAQRRMERRLQGKLSGSDLRQLTYLESFENLNHFQGNTFEEFGSWLLRIMDRTCNIQTQAFHRKARDVSREVPLEDVKKELVTGQSGINEDKRIRPFEVAWRELPYRYQQVIHWRYYEKYTHEEIGGRLGLTADAAKHLYRRAVRKLVDKVEKHKESSWSS